MAVSTQPNNMTVVSTSTPMASDSQPEGSVLDQSFVADRAIFWGRFTNFVRLGIGAVILVLLFLLFFVYL